MLLLILPKAIFQLIQIETLFKQFKTGGISLCYSSLILLLCLQYPKGNYVIKLRQEEPIENIPGSEPTVQTNEIASIILDKECALTLANAILEFQDPSDNDSDS